MLVRQIIEVLQERYSPETELFIEWWDKEGIEYSMGEAINNDVWARAVEIAEDGDQSYPNSMISEMLSNSIDYANGEYND